MQEKRKCWGVNEKDNSFIIYINNFFPLLHALIEVDITRGNLNPLPINIAVSALYSDKQTSDALKKRSN